MAGICVVLFLLLLIFVISPILLFLVFGLIAAAVITVLTAIVATIVFIVLTKKGVFKKYACHEKKAVRFGVGALRILLIVIMVLAWLLTVVCGVLMIVWLY